MKPSYSEALGLLKNWLTTNVNLGVQIQFDREGEIRSAEILAALFPQPDRNGHLPFTVVSVEPNEGQINVDYVQAADSDDAFTTVCLSRGCDLQPISCTPGHVGEQLTTPGDAVVDADQWLENHGGDLLAVHLKNNNVEINVDNGGAYYWQQVTHVDGEPWNTHAEASLRAIDDLGLALEDDDSGVLVAPVNQGEEA